MTTPVTPNDIAWDAATGDFPPTFPDATGDAVLLQWTAYDLQTPTGSVYDAPLAGYSVPAQTSSASTARTPSAQALAVSQQAEAALLRDERIQAAAVKVTGPHDVSIRVVQATKAPVFTCSVSRVSAKFLLTGAQ